MRRSASRPARARSSRSDSIFVWATNAFDIDGRRLTLEDPNARVFEDATDLLLTVGVVVVVAEHGHHRHQQTAQLVGEDLDLLRSTASRQVTGEQQEISAVSKM